MNLATQINPDIDSVIEVHRSENWANLSPDRRAFAIAYVETMSHVEAARRVGKPGQGLRYMRDPQTAALIADLQAETFKYNVVTEAFVQQQLIALLPKLMGEEPIALVDKDGVTYEGCKFHASESRAAIASLGDSLKRVNGMTIHVDKKETIDHNVTIKDVENLYAAIAAKQAEADNALPCDVAVEAEFEEVVDE